jgi:hypothetical protein
MLPGQSRLIHQIQRLEPGFNEFLITITPEC